MEKTIIIVLIVMLILFVPFTPFRLMKRLIFKVMFYGDIFNFKFDDIGGAPFFGLRLFNVESRLQENSSFTAKELRFKHNLWNIIRFRKTALYTISIIEPKIVFDDKTAGKMNILTPLEFFGDLIKVISNLIITPINKMRESADQDFYFFMFSYSRFAKIVKIPFKIIKYPLSLAEKILLKNVIDIRVIGIRIVDGFYSLKGSDNNITDITALNGEFFIHQTSPKPRVHSLSFNIGDGAVDINRAKDGGLDIHAKGVRLEKMSAIKLPNGIAGPVDIKGTIDDENNVKMTGTIESPCITLREQPIRNFTSPLHFEGVTLSLTEMRGEVGDYSLTGTLDNDVVTDRVLLKLKGGGEGRGGGLIFKMLNMKPYILTANMDAQIDLEGNFEVFEDITGSIIVKLKDARINPEAFSEKSKPGKTIPRFPILNFDLFMQEGSLYTESIEAVLPGARIHLGGRIDMTVDKELDKVTETVYDLSASVRNDDTFDPAPDTGFALNMPAEFDGRLKLSTSSKIDPADFRATGNVELKNILISAAKLGPLARFSDIMEVFLRGIKGDLDITAKRIRLKNAHIDGVWMYIALEGDIGLDGALDLYASLKIISNRDTERDSHRLLRIPLKLISGLKTGFHITGTASKPKIKLSGREF